MITRHTLFLLFLLGAVGCDALDSKNEDQATDVNASNDIATDVSVVATDGYAADASLQELLDIVVYRPSRELTVFRGDNVYAADSDGRLFHSTDRGYSWSKVTIPVDESVTFLQFDATGQGAVVATDAGTLLRSRDGGATWQHSNLDTLVGDAAESDWYASYDAFRFDEELQNGYWVEYCTIFRTTDGGTSWQALGKGLEDKGGIDRCAYDVTETGRDGLLLAGVSVDGRMLTSGDYLYASKDNGVTWREVCWMEEFGQFVKGVPNCYKMRNVPPEWRQLTGELEAGDYSIAEAFLEDLDEAVFKNGHHPIPGQLANSYESVGLVRDTTTGRTWYDDYDRLAYTDDGGETWQVVTSGAIGTESIDYSLGDARVFAVHDYGGLYSSSDGGRNWSEVVGAPAEVFAVTVVAAHNRVVAANEEGLWSADADELEWQEGPRGWHSRTLVADDVLWSFEEEGKAFRSTDGGTNWDELPVNLSESGFYLEDATCDANRCVLYGSDDEYAAVARISSGEDGVSVTSLYGDIDELEEDYVVGIDFDRGNLDRGWLALEGGKIFATTDAGASWAQVEKFRGMLSELLLSRGGSHVLILTEDDRYLRSDDGQSFEDTRLPLADEGYIESVCWLTDNVALMYAYDDEDYSQYYATTDGGQSWQPTSWGAYDSDCVVPGDMVYLSDSIAQLR